MRGVRWGIDKTPQKQRPTLPFEAFIFYNIPTEATF